MIAPWPERLRWLLILTHNVETLSGTGDFHLSRDLELEAGIVRHGTVLTQESWSDALDGAPRLRVSGVCKTHH